MMSGNIFSMAVKSDVVCICRITAKAIQTYPQLMILWRMFRKLSLDYHQIPILSVST